MSSGESITSGFGGEVTVLSVLRQCEEMLKAHDLSCLHGSTFAKCIVCQKGNVANIGRVDELGAFQLDPELSRLLAIEEDESFWTKFRNDLNRKSEKEAEDQSKALLKGLIQEVARTMREEEVPGTFLPFLAQK